MNFQSYRLDRMTELCLASLLFATTIIGGLWMWWFVWHVERERDGVEMLALVEDVFGSTPLKAVDMGTEKALAGFSRF